MSGNSMNPRRLSVLLLFSLTAACALSVGKEVRAQETRGVREVLARQMREERQEVRERLRQIRERETRLRERTRDLQQVVVRFVSRVRLGVELDPAQGPADDELGARLRDVMDDSPAEEAGLREGDVITHLGGRSLLEPLPDPEEEEELDEEESLPVQRLMALGRELEPGGEVEVRYLRDGEARTVAVEAAEVEWPEVRVGRVTAAPRFEGEFFPFGGHVFVRPELKGLERLERLERLEELEELDFELELPPLERLREPELGLWRHRGPGGQGAWFWEGWAGGALAGLRYAELNPELGEYFSTSEGLLILEVDEESELGLRPGDVIQAIDGRPVEDGEDLRRILGSYEKGEAVTFTVVRRGDSLSVEGRR